MACVPSSTLSRETCFQICDDFVSFGDAPEECLQCLSVFDLDNRNAVHAALEHRHLPFAPNVPVCGAPRPTITAGPLRAQLHKREVITTSAYCTVPTTPDKDACEAICKDVIRDFGLCLDGAACICDRVLKISERVNLCLGCSDQFDMSYLNVYENIKLPLQNCMKPTTASSVCGQTTIDNESSCAPPTASATACRIPNPQNQNNVQCQQPCLNVIAELDLCATGDSGCICNAFNRNEVKLRNCLLCDALFNYSSSEVGTPITEMKRRLYDRMDVCGRSVDSQEQCEYAEVPGECVHVDPPAPEPSPDVSSAEPSPSPVTSEGNDNGSPSISEGNVYCAVPTTPDKDACEAICKDVIRDFGLCLDGATCICDRVLKIPERVNLCLGCSDQFDMNYLNVYENIKLPLQNCMKPTTASSVCGQTTINSESSCAPPTSTATACRIPNPQNQNNVQCQQPCLNVIAELDLCATGDSGCICNTFNRNEVKLRNCLLCDALFNYSSSEVGTPITEMKRRLYDRMDVCGRSVDSQEQCEYAEVPGECVHVDPPVPEPSPDVSSAQLSPSPVTSDGNDNGSPTTSQVLAYCTVPTTPDKDACEAICKDVIRDFGLCLDGAACICDRVLKIPERVNLCLGCSDQFDMNYLNVYENIKLPLQNCMKPTTASSVCGQTTINSESSCAPPTSTATACRIPNPQNQNNVQCQQPCLNVIAELDLCATGDSGCICNAFNRNEVKLRNCLLCDALFNYSSSEVGTPITEMKRRLYDRMDVCGRSVDSQEQCEYAEVPGECVHVDPPVPEPSPDVSSAEPSPSPVTSEDNDNGFPSTTQGNSQTTSSPIPDNDEGTGSGDEDESSTGALSSVSSEDNNNGSPSTSQGISETSHTTDNGSGTPTSVSSEDNNNGSPSTSQ
ncbi:hypothetical protein B0I73DRAFT_150078, partial [Yarrowia lipolytica]